MRGDCSVVLSVFVFGWEYCIFLCSTKHTRKEEKWLTDKRASILAFRETGEPGDVLRISYGYTGFNSERDKFDRAWHTPWERQLWARPFRFSFASHFPGEGLLVGRGHSRRQTLCETKFGRTCVFRHRAVPPNEECFTNKPGHLKRRYSKVSTDFTGQSEKQVQKYHQFVHAQIQKIASAGWDLQIPELPIPVERLRRTSLCNKRRLERFYSSSAHKKRHTEDPSTSRSVWKSNQPSEPFHQQKLQCCREKS